MFQKVPWTTDLRDYITIYSTIMPVNLCPWSFLASCFSFQGSIDVSIDVISQALPASHKTLPPLDFPELLLALHGWIRWFQSRMVMNWDLGACQQPLYTIAGTMSIPLVWKVWWTLLNEESLGISKDLTHTRVSRVRYYDNTMIILSPFAQDWSNNTTKPELPLNNSRL